MAKAAEQPKVGAKKRTAGRPAVGKNDVGGEHILGITEALLRTMPPARVTLTLIAKEADVDPALVRYYFGNRTALLMAVVDRVTGHGVHSTKTREEPVTELADHIGRTVQFVRSATFMHRLVIDELAQAGTEESRSRVRAMNLDLVDLYRQLLQADGGKELTATDPLFLHLAVLGASDFFASAQPLIRELVPEDTDMEQLSGEFKGFLVRLMLDGLRKR